MTSAPSSHGLTGSWAGTFKGQPENGREETVTPFELKIRQSRDSIHGTLTVLSAPPRQSDARDGFCDTEGCSFEVTDSGDAHEIMSWRVHTENGQLHGSRNGGPLTSLGVGAGVRFFKIEAKRKSPDGPSGKP